MGTESPMPVTIRISVHDGAIVTNNRTKLVTFFERRLGRLKKIKAFKGRWSSVDKDERLATGRALIIVREQSEAEFGQLEAMLGNSYSLRTIRTMIQMAELYSTPEGKLDYDRMIKAQKEARNKRANEAHETQIEQELDGYLERDPREMYFHDMVRIAHETSTRKAADFGRRRPKSEEGEQHEEDGSDGADGSDEAYGSDGGTDDRSGVPFEDEPAMVSQPAAVALAVAERHVPALVARVPVAPLQAPRLALAAQVAPRHEQLSLESLYADIESARNLLTEGLRMAAGDNGSVGWLRDVARYVIDQFAARRSDGGGL